MSGAETERWKEEGTCHEQPHQSRFKGGDIEMVHHFTYLASMVDEKGGTERHIVLRLSKARAAFYTLTPVFSSKVFSTRTTISLYN